jgi:hypothetical protein
MVLSNIYITFKHLVFCTDTPILICIAIAHLQLVYRDTARALKSEVKSVSLSRHAWPWGGAQQLHKVSLLCLAGHEGALWGPLLEGVFSSQRFLNL